MVIADHVEQAENHFSNVLMWLEDYIDEYDAHGAPEERRDVLKAMGRVVGVLIEKLDKLVELQDRELFAAKMEMLGITTFALHALAPSSAFTDVP